MTDQSPKISPSPFSKLFNANIHTKIKKKIVIVIAANGGWTWKSEQMKWLISVATGSILS